MTVGLAERLRALPQFAALSDADLDAVAAAFVVHDVRDGHVFIHEGERGGDLFVLIDGQIAVTARDDDLERELAVLGPGDLFGLVALVDQGPRSATCRACGPCRVGTLAGNAAALLFNQRAAIACAFQQVLALQLARDFRRLETTLRAMV